LSPTFSSITRLPRTHPSRMSKMSSSVWPKPKPNPVGPKPNPVGSTTFLYYTTLHHHDITRAHTKHWKQQPSPRCFFFFYLSVHAREFFFDMQNEQTESGKKRRRRRMPLKAPTSLLPLLLHPPLLPLLSKPNGSSPLPLLPLPLLPSLA
jgi:hypothetical protein